MKHKIGEIELLSPAGNITKMKTAFAHGADAVYLGVPDFSLRVRINDFDMPKIKEAIKYAHDRGKKVYVTINIFAHNKHLKKLSPYIKKLKEYGADALIVSDPGVLGIIKKEWPKAEIHLSTQANCTNWQAAKFWHEQGVVRIILGREVTLDEIKEIYDKVPQVELEYFVHGAMCMAYSGRCFLSKYYMGRSGNLGDCVQPCRWEHQVESVMINEVKRPDIKLKVVEEGHGSYILNSKDLCLLEYLAELKKAGVVSFKIEGRAKSAYYQAVVTGIYRRAIDLIESKKNTVWKKSELKRLKKELDDKLVHRGYTTGFLLGETADQNIDNSHNKCDWEFCGEVVGGDSGEMRVKVHNTLRVGDEIEIVLPAYDIISMKVGRIRDCKNQKDIKEAHGGGSKHEVVIDVDGEVPVYSVIRRKLKD